MIATCNACQTRFRVADDKVGPRGVKVRCSKCQTIFLVLPPPAAPAAPPASAAPADPFARQGSGPAGAPADPFAPPPPAPRADPFAAASGPSAPLGAPFDPRQSAELPAPPADPFSSPSPQAAPGDPFTSPPPGAAAAPAGFDPFSAPEPLGLEAPEPRPSPPPSHPGATDLDDLLGAAPARPGSSAPFDDSFAEGDLGGGAAAAEGSGLELDLPSRAPAPAPEPPPGGTGPAEPAPPPVRAPAPARSAPAPRPAPEEPPEPERPARSRLRAVAVNALWLGALLALAVGFFAFWRGEGRVDLRLLFQRDDAAPVSAPGQPLIVAARMSNGIYETAHGRLIFVRGELQARDGIGSPLKVKVALLDGERVAAEVEGLAGAVPTPEELYGVASPADAATLAQGIAGRAAPRATPGEWLPFLVPLADVPADRRFALRVRAEPVR